MGAHGELHAQAGELKAMKNAMIRYILNVAPKRTPFKSIDIVKQCLRGEQKWFVHLLPEVQDALNDVYGLVIHEIKDKSGKFYLVTSEFGCGSEVEYTNTQREELRLLLIVLSYIFMKGGKIIEPALFGFLRKLNVDEEPHDYFGHFKRNISETFVKQQYLKKEKIEMESGNIEERFQYSWGHRADLEFKKLDCLTFVAEVLKRPPTAFVAQYEQCNSDTEDTDMAEE